MSEDKNYAFELVNEVISNDDIKELANDTLDNFVSTFCGDEFVSKINKFKQVAKVTLDMRSYFFLAKLKCYLKSIYTKKDGKYTFEHKINMASIFCEDEKNYHHYIQHTISFIDQLETNDKIEYYGVLTRYLLLELMDYGVFLRLSQILKSCTSYELSFIKEQPLNYICKNDFMTSSLIIQGLMQRKEDRSHDYEFTDLAKKMKMYCLSSEIPISETIDYNAIKPIPQLEPMSDAEATEAINAMFDK